ncbi:hypothetical protein BKA25_001341 [Actinoalloteichus hymeniacidonis]|uniref:Uncharacterized protein n=1 Tax=Actinoalloteichus hymeniacidonis TaxID=340345 RepID=A0AAC9HT52_9PSEU|nr:hypothetical protein TL08_20545 [Actinoalloteichus hymeniacidonis]MBB5907025.1 hypothetical protein [Actinoalloteichus hymeniacidonis]
MIDTTDLRADCSTHGPQSAPGVSAPVSSTLRRSRFSERHKLPVGNRMPPGTNGYTTSWGTNAHGELSACPPGSR